VASHLYEEYLDFTSHAQNFQSQIKAAFFCFHEKAYSPSEHKNQAQQHSIPSYCIALQRIFLSNPFNSVEINMKNEKIPHFSQMRDLF